MNLRDGFLHRLDAAQFDVGRGYHLRVRFVGEGMWCVEISQNAREWNVITNGEEGVVYYPSFVDALEALMDLEEGL